MKNMLQNIEPSMKRTAASSHRSGQSERGTSPKIKRKVLEKVRNTNRKTRTEVKKQAGRNTAINAVCKVSNTI